MEDIYGYRLNGEVIKAPKGWKIIPVDSDIPQMHREYRESEVCRGIWCDPRRCHGTMTPMSTRLWGWVRAFAEKEE